MAMDFKPNSKKYNKMYNPYLFFAACITILIIFLTARYYAKPTAQYSLYNTLDYYGFSSKEQKDALEKLMQHASILEIGQTIEDKFPARRTSGELIIDLLKFAKLTQEHFSIRSAHQERWEVSPSKWMIENNDDNLRLLAILGMTSEIKPQNKTTDALCILGATMPRMVDRIDYAHLLTNEGFNVNNLILLAGERYVTAEIDGTEEELRKIAESYNLSSWQKVTETQLIQTAYKQSKLFGKIPTFTIDTPARDLPRPTTQTTILELIEWLKSHNNIKSITFVSNQPYVKYQEAVIRGIVTSSDISLKFEVVGNASQKKEVQPIIEALGSYIFAQTLNVITDMNMEGNNSLINSSLKTLYKNYPLIYHKLKA